MVEEIYKTTVFCTNCVKDKQIDVPKGTVVEEYLLRLRKIRLRSMRISIERKEDDLRVFLSMGEDIENEN